MGRPEEQVEWPAAQMHVGREASDECKAKRFPGRVGQGREEGTRRELREEEGVRGEEEEGSPVHVELSYDGDWTD